MTSILRRSSVGYSGRSGHGSHRHRPPPKLLIVAAFCLGATGPAPLALLLGGHFQEAAHRGGQAVNVAAIVAVAVDPDRRREVLAGDSAAAAGRGLCGSKITPREWKRRRGLRLCLVYRRRGPSLLVADRARINRRGQAVASRSKTGS